MYKIRLYNLFMPERVPKLAGLFKRISKLTRLVLKEQEIKLHVLNLSFACKSPPQFNLLHHMAL